MNAFIKGELKGYSREHFNEEMDLNQAELKMHMLSGDTLCIEDIGLFIHQIELEEDLVFDSRRSEHYFIPVSLKMNFPIALNKKGIIEPFVYFNFKDCEKIFLNDPHAVSYHPLKSGKNINFADIFKIRLFNSTIVKFGSDELYIEQDYQTPQSAFIYGKQKENELTEILFKFYHPQ